MLGTLADAQRGITAASRECDQRPADAIAIAVALINPAGGGAIRFRRECPS